MRKFLKSACMIMAIVSATATLSACENLPFGDLFGSLMKPAKPHEHELVYVEAKEAGYAVHGNEEHYKCDCGAVFTDESGETATTLQEVTIRSETGFDKQVYTMDDYALNYCVYEPEELDKEEDKVPLILFLHGSGERGTDNELQLKNAILKVNKTGEWAKSVILAPQCPSQTSSNTNSGDDGSNRWVASPGSAGNYKQSDYPESEPLHAAAQLTLEYSNYDYIDADRIYVVGLSMGGLGTWDILARYPDLFAAGVPICGGGPTDKIEVLKDIPIYAFHGTADTSVPYGATQEMYQKITAAGGNKMIFKTYSGAGHGIWDDAITYKGDGTNAYPALEDWLFSQSK